MSTPTCSVMYINKANLDDLMSINNIGEKRAKSITVLPKKGKLTLEYLKTMPNIPSTIWDPLVEEGVIKIKSKFKQPEEQTTN